MGVGAPVSGSRPEAGLGEGDHVADGLAAPASSMISPVPAERDAAVRRRAVLERVEQEAELARCASSADRPITSNTRLLHRRRGGYGSSRRRSRSRCSTMSYASASAPPGSAVELVGPFRQRRGERVVHRPSSRPRRSVLARTSARPPPTGTTRPTRRSGRSAWPISNRAAPSSSLGRSTRRQPRRTRQSPGLAPVAVGQAGPLGLGQVLGHRAGELAGPRRSAT